ncbi:MAG TPA: hypothetical protein VKT77_08515, partial [Chthonomonadaceae bacterium]|nr:hypothetical protein [Chthonomonadaceae bacterium]
MGRVAGASDDRLTFALAVAIACLAAVVRLWISHRTHAVGEDALITLRYAENIAAGRGWVYNPGEHVLGATTPLFTLILAVAAWLRLPAMPAGIALGAAADGVTCLLIARLLARPEIGRPAAGLCAALLYALSSTPISVSISGMETPLVACAGMAAIHACVAGRERVLYGWCGLLYLLRIDGLALFVILAAVRCVRTRRISWSALLLFAAIAAPWTLFATAYFGSPVPESVTAKLTVYRSQEAAPAIAAGNAQAFRSQFFAGGTQCAVTLLFAIGAAAVVAAVPRRPGIPRRDGSLDSTTDARHTPTRTASLEASAASSPAANQDPEPHDSPPSGG